MKENFLENYELVGDKLPISTYPAPVLKKVAAPVTEFNDDLRALIKDMLFTMYHAPGIGLAAPQVGHSIRLFVLVIWFEREKVTLPDGSTEYRFFDFQPMVFINPVFKNKSGEIIHEEGCLSVPGIYDSVTRAERVTVEALNEQGEKFTLEAEGLLAICIQHELDHLIGKVFVEYLSVLKQDRIKTKLKKRIKHDL